MTGDAARRRLLASLLVVAVLATLATPAVGAQENDTIAPYYEGEQPQVDNETWMEGNEEVTGESLVTYLSRVGTFVVGGDAGSSGPLLTGMVLLGAGIGLAVGAPVGIIGGGVLALVSLWGVVSVGLAPAWVLPVTVFGLAVFAASAVRGLLR